MRIQQMLGFSTNRWRARWLAFRRPLNEEKQLLLRARWESLATELKTPNQISGRHLTHCGFTTGASYCSFRCTHCYLPENANRVPIPSVAQMKEQIDANRRLQGPDGGLEITGGDVADAYFKSGRQDELVDIVRYAVDRTRSGARCRPGGLRCRAFRVCSRPHIGSAPHRQHWNAQFYGHCVRGKCRQ